MSITEKINADLKSAMLSGDKTKVETLKGLKNAFLYEAVAAGAQDKNLGDEAALKVLAREAKKRIEAAELYEKAGELERAKAEKAEKAIVDIYLPQQLSEDELKQIVAKKVAEIGASSQADMGKVIGAVRAQTGASADGAQIAKLVREALGQ